MKPLYFLLVLIIFSACVTQRKCTERFPCISGVDSFYREILLPVEVIVPAETLIIETEVPCEDFELKVENSKLLASLKVVNGILWAKMQEKPDTFIKYVPKIEERIKEVTKPVEVRYVPKFVKILAGIGIASIIIIIAYLALKMRLKIFL